MDKEDGVLVLKKNEILLFAITWMDLESIMLNEIRQRQMPYDFTHMWNLRNKEIKKIDIKNKQTNKKTQILKCGEQTSGC